jgi:glycosyltransferase involved in cell wall biosynthesis
MKKLISVVTPCYNEEGNVRELYERIKAAFDKLKDKYRYEQIFIDNASKDGTVAELRKICAADPNVKVIVNVRNFGQVRSPAHALMQARGDAVIGMASDLQDPPELIPQFLARWEEGYKVALGVRASTQESWPMHAVRGVYYKLLARVSDVETVHFATGFGLFDREVMDQFRSMNDPYPYFRGILSELGYPIAKIPYDQPLRKRGLTSNNFYTLFDLAMLGLTTHSKVPLRLATIAGFGLSALSMFVALGYLVAKLVFWSQFQLGVAPILIGIFATFSVQLFFLGLLGEYIGAVHTQLARRPLVIEKERINFEDAPVARLSAGSEMKQ